MVNVRIGQFVPDIVTYITNHRSLTHSAYAFNTFAADNTSFKVGHVHGATSFGIESFQLGAEASGLFSSRLRYALGIVNGNGINEDNNSAKDFYGKLGFKAGGLAFDGSSTGDIYGPSANNWAEKSITVSAFGYFGTGTHTEDEESNGDGHDHLATETSDDFNFRRIGADVNVFFRDLNLFGGYINGTDDEKKYDLFFTEANYMIYPWLIGVLRYEQANPENQDPIKQLVTHLTTLYTANVKFNIEIRFDPDNIEISNLFVGIDFAF